MKLSIKDLKLGVEEGIISGEQLDALVELSRRNPENNRVMNLFYYLGALLVISAMSWLMARSWDLFGGGGIALVTAVYIAGFLIAAQRLYFVKGMRVPGGLLFTVVICLMPLFVYGLLKFLNIWPDYIEYGDFYIWVKGRWVVLELAGILTGLLILYFVRFPFVLAPIAFGLWFLSMDIAPIIMQVNEIGWFDRKHISIIFGVVMLIAGYIVHLKAGRRFSFWLYFWGALMLTAAFSVYYSDEILKLLMLLGVSLVFILLYLVLEQKSFLVFGAIGLVEVLGRLSYDIFGRSVLLPFFYTALGLLLVFAGVFYQRHQRRIDDRLAKIVPGFLRRLKPADDD